MSLKDLIKKAAEGDAVSIAALEKLEERTSYLEGELDKAIKARDKAKGDLTLSKTEKDELDSLRAKAAEADEVQLKAKGDYEALKAKAEKQVAAAEAKATAASERFANKAIETSFASAFDLFGPKGRTILTPDFARAGFASHVKFVPGETGDGGSVIVQDLKGDAILGKDGKPAPFAEAMGRLIETWPTKDAILRGGGKAGSGTAGSGESTGTSATRAEMIKRAAAGDPNALADLQKAPSPGRQVSGLHWERQAQKPESPATR